VQWDELISAERNYIYSQRRLKFNKGVMLINIVEDYLTILQQQKNIENFRRNVQSAKMLLNQAQALFRLGRVTKGDVFRAEFQKTTAEIRLLRAQEELRLSKNALKILLGLDPRVVLELDPFQIEYTPTQLDLPDYIKGALATNPEWLNARDRLEDAKRDLYIAEKKSRSRFDLIGSYGGLKQPGRVLLDGTEIPAPGHLA
jgi:outer membrane protein TolC